ncbi:MAG: CoA transferase [Gammaproteobacteria bacterium]|nr:CoA transferase [Gammaproteobacteria bacterium]MBQ0838685.1 CoA transferase [Gammaproteobacteria bacterium]
MTSNQQHMLSGIRILDLTRALAGPSCTRMFAELGAEVIKVEPATSGDMVRGISKLRGERSLYIIQQSLNKKSLCVNLRDPEGLALVRELVPHCDAVVENFKPGIMADMGLGYEDLCKLKSDIILCSISALGQTGPLSHKPGYDYIAQAYAGITSMIGEADEAPHIPLAGIGDVSTGVHGAFAIAAALLNRANTGQGQHLDIAILDCYYHCHEINVHQASGSGGAIKPMRGGRHLSYLCPAGLFNGTGGNIVLMGFMHHWKDVCAAMNRPELIDDPLFATDAVRLERRDAVVKIIEGWLATFADVHSAVAKLEAHGIPCAPVLSVEETLSHPHLVERGTVRTVNDRLAGEFQIPGMPIKTSAYPAEPDYRAPTLGEHNREILSEVLKRSDAEIDALVTAGVLASGDY